MLDVGDLREGIYFTDIERIYATVQETITCPNINIVGIGTNLTCYGGVVPSVANMNLLVKMAERIEKHFNIKLDVISGGNSSALLLLQSGEMPKRINNLRLGESLLLGVETARGTRIKGTYDDVTILKSEIIEIGTKPSCPIGETTINAFGEHPTFSDEGNRLRAIIAIGRQDIDYAGLVPIDSNIKILGASSDHLILDITNAHTYKVGDKIYFKLKYGALLQCFTSNYVEKIFIE